MEANVLHLLTSQSASSASIMFKTSLKSLVPSDLKFSRISLELVSPQVNVCFVGFSFSRTNFDLNRRQTQAKGSWKRRGFLWRPNIQWQNSCTSSFQSNFFFNYLVDRKPFNYLSIVITGKG